MRAVGNLRVAATTTSSITLAWDPPGGPIQADGYVIIWPQSGVLRSKGPMSFIYASTQ